jgi:aspartyl-tRNA(Asn)/glutamyl-tRNA(Gln) amidotransferase subunit C
MAFNETNIPKLERLSNIRLDKDKIAKYTRDIQGIIEIISELRAVPTQNIEPLVTVIDGVSPMRLDEVTEKNRLEQIIKNAPDARHGYFVVPKVVE